MKRIVSPELKYRRDPSVPFDTVDDDGSWSDGDGTPWFYHDDLIPHFPELREKEAATRIEFVAKPTLSPDALVVVIPPMSSWTLEISDDSAGFGDGLNVVCTASIEGGSQYVPTIFFAWCNDACREFGIPPRKPLYVSVRYWCEPRKKRHE